MKLDIIQNLSRIFFILNFCILIQSNPSFSEISGGVSKTEKEADKLYKAGKLRNALYLYLDVEKEKEMDAALAYKIGVCYLNSSEKEKSIPYFLQNKKLAKEDNPMTDYFLGHAYHFDGQFDQAIKYYNQYKAILDDKDEYEQEEKKEIDRIIQSIEQAKIYYSKPSKDVVNRLNSKVNSPYADLSPVLTPDGKNLFFGSRRFFNTGNEYDKKSGEYYEDIFVSHLDSATWSSGKPVTKKINSRYNETPLFITADGKELMICKSDKNDVGDLYLCELRGESWDSPVALPEDHINTPYWETGGSMSADSKILYFVSDKPEGMGGLDIYYSIKQADGKWGPAINIGPEINTPYNEESPIITEGNILYFTSEGHNTLGGFDVFRARFNPESKKWEAPENLGFPVNSTADELSISLTYNGENGVFSSTRKGSFGDEDLYMVKLHKEPKPAVIALAETTSDVKKGSKKKEKNGNVNINPEQNGGKGTANNTSSKISGGAVYGNNSVHPANASSTNNHVGSDTKNNSRMTATNTGNTPSSVNNTALLSELLNVKPEKGQLLKVKAHFPFNVANTITEYSQERLDIIVQLLEKYPDIKLEICGYSDNFGDESSIKNISIKRAETVRKYLTGKGISKDRLTTKGCGNSMLLIDSNDKQENVKNRRVEFKVIN